MPDKLIKVKIVADICGCHPNTIWSRVRNDAMPKPKKFGGGTYWRESEIAAYIREPFRITLADTVADRANAK